MNKVKALKEIINLKEIMMMESQAQIRQAEKIVETMKRIYTKASEDRAHLQKQLIDELEKNAKEAK